MIDSSGQCVTVRSGQMLFYDYLSDQRLILYTFRYYGGKNAMIRHATISDASRIAEILIFAKRVHYRRIFSNDKVSFGEMQVYPLAKRYIENPDALKGIWVYDDEFVKGMIHVDDKQILELYVDSFFENQGIGSDLITFAVEQMGCDYLWVLEKNSKAICFYQRHGFRITLDRKHEEGTAEYIVKMSRHSLPD